MAIILTKTMYQEHLFLALSLNFRISCIFQVFQLLQPFLCNHHNSKQVSCVPTKVVLICTNHASFLSNGNILIPLIIGAASNSLHPCAIAVLLPLLTFLYSVKKRKEEIEIINEADAVVYTSERLFEDMKGKVNDSKLDDVKKEIDELKKLLEEKKTSEIKKKLEHVNKKMQELSIEMYQKVSEQANKSAEEQQQQSEGPPPDENIVDAEYTEKTEEKKKK